MRATTMLLVVAVLAILFLLLTDPEAVIGSFFTAAFVLVLWRLVVSRGGLMRRGGRR